MLVSIEEKGGKCKNLHSESFVQTVGQLDFIQSGICKKSLERFLLFEGKINFLRCLLPF